MKHAHVKALFETKMREQNIRDTYRYFLTYIKGTPISSIYSDMLWVFEDGMNIPFDIDVNGYHSDPIVGGVVPFHSRETFKYPNGYPVWFLQRGKEEDARAENSITESLALIKFRKELSSREDKQRRYEGKCHLSNISPCEHDDCTVICPKSHYGTHDTFSSISHLRSSMLPCIQPWMVGMKYSNELLKDDRFIEVLPSWFVFAPRVKYDKMAGFIKFLKTRYSETDWNLKMKKIVPNRVFDDCVKRFHYQNIRGYVFFNMRLLFCIERFDSENLEKAVQNSDISQYYRTAFKLDV